MMCSGPKALRLTAAVRDGPFVVLTARHGARPAYPQALCFGMKASSVPWSAIEAARDAYRLNNGLSKNQSLTFDRYRVLIPLSPHSRDPSSLLPRIKGTPSLIHLHHTYCYSIIFKLSFSLPSPRQLSWNCGHLARRPTTFPNAFPLGPVSQWTRRFTLHH
jgi:hypothetical protein